MTPDEADRIERRLEAFGIEIREGMTKIANEVSAMKVLVHAPGNCELGDRVRDMELQQAKAKGMFVTIGFFVTAVSATIGGLIVKFWK